jgi:hypothetical protein
MGIASAPPILHRLLSRRNITEIKTPLIPCNRSGSIFCIRLVLVSRIFRSIAKNRGGTTKEVVVGNDVQTIRMKADADRVRQQRSAGDRYRSLTAAIIAIVTLAGASSAYAEKVYYLHDPGGNVGVHIYTYTRVNEDYDRVVIDGQCKSACTTVLGVVPLNKICIAPSGYFMFHAAHNRDRSFNPGQTELMMQAYAPEVRDWVMRHHALEHVDPYTYLYPRNVTFIRHCRR